MTVDNHRITNAIIATKLDSLISLVQQHYDDTSSKLMDLATDVTALKIASAQNNLRISRNEQEIEGQKRKGLAWDVMNSVGALVAFLLGKAT